MSEKEKPSEHSLKRDGHINIDLAGDDQQPEFQPETFARYADPTPVETVMVETPDTEHQALDLLRALYRRRWSAVTVFIVVFGSAIAWSYTTVPVYEATTRLLIEAETPNVISFKEVITEDPNQAAYYQTQYTILESRSLARRTLQGLNMLPSTQSPAVKTAATPAPMPPDDLVTRVKNATGVDLAGIAWIRTLMSSVQNAAPRLPNETAAESGAIDGLLGHLRVSPVRNSRLVDLRYRSTDPDLATRIVNAHAHAFVEQTLEYKFLSSKEATDWLSNQLSEQRKQVETAELALQQYRENEAAVSLDERQNIVVQKLADLNAAVTRAKTERIEKEAFYNQVRSVQNNPAAIDTIPAILANSFIQQLKGDMANLQRQQTELLEQLGEKHPDIVRVKTQLQIAQARLQIEIGKIVESFRHEYETSVERERSLVGALEAQKTEALALNRKGIEYDVLRRDAESSRQVYESLLQRVKETEVSTELKTSNVRIVDPAERPQRPILPERQQDLGVGALAGLVLALAVAFGFEYLDNRIKTPEDIKTWLGVAWLGLIPVLSAKQLKKAGGAPLINKGVPLRFTEALRTVRTNVVFSSAQPGARSIIVTSAGPGEGKTVVSTNLAIALATAGQRVLLIDADMRRPKVHELFSHKANPGLSHLLVGDATAQEVIYTTSISGLRILPAGRIPPNPAELLSSRRFVKFLTAVGEHFNWIIIDSPPVMAVTDACIIAHETSGVLFVTAAEMTSGHAAHEALERLRGSHAVVLGAVLNFVDLDGKAYYYSKYYNREYQKYYSATPA